jgi:hypothetical protein
MEKSFPLITQGSLEAYLSNNEIIKLNSSNKKRYEVLKTPENIYQNFSPDLFNSRYVIYEPYGQPVKGDSGEKLLGIFRKSVLDVARKYGFPDLDKFTEERRFDYELSYELWRLTKEVGLDVTQASNDGVWNYLQGFLLPDLVIWRWSLKGEVNRERFIRIERGALSSLWWRYYTFSDMGQNEFPEWIHHLTSDDIVQILERTRVRGYHPIVIPFAKKISQLRESSSNGKNTTLLIRTAVKRLRIFLGVKNIWGISQHETNMNGIVDDIFEEAKLMLFKNNP